MKTKIGVFFGGRSVEHEVSIISALQAVAAFDRNLYDVIPIYMTKDGAFYVGEKIGDIKAYRNVPALLKESKRVVLIPKNGQAELHYYPLKHFGKSLYDVIDVAFPIVHGTNVEDGALQGFFRTLQIPFAGCDVLSSAVGMDKYVMKAVLKDNGVPILPCLRIRKRAYFSDPDTFIGNVEETIGFPCIVKPINLGSSIGIRKADESSSLRDAIEYAFSFASEILVEEAVQNLKEINCSVVGDGDGAEASECEEPISDGELLDFDAKYRKGGKGSKGDGMANVSRKIPADISKEERDTIRDLAVRAFLAMGCSGIARIDFMMDTKTRKIYLTEVNTIPGSLAFYLWEPLGVPYSELLTKAVKLALKRRRESEELNYSFDTDILANASFGGSKGSKR